MKSSLVFGLVLIAMACGLQAAFAPTVRVTCPARTAAAPDCEMRWFVAFDLLPVRITPLPALQPVGEIVMTSTARRANRSTLYLNTSNGPVRSIMWGDQPSLQRELRNPLQAYFANPQAPALDTTMWPSRWVDPGGTADNRLVRKADPIRLVANGLIIFGLLFWVWLPVQLAQAVRRKSCPA